MSEAEAHPPDDGLLDVEWHDPPPSGKYGNLLERYVNTLKTRPGEWGELPPFNGEFYPLTVGTMLRRQYPGVEYTSRATGTKQRYRIWARWVGEPEPAPAAPLRPVRGRRG